MSREPANPLAPEDGHLVDLAAAALVDPNLHADLRLRLHREITELVATTHETIHGPAHPDTPRLPAAGEPAPQDQSASVALLQSLLVDPNLHTDLRMRLHREIPEMVRAAHERARRPGALNG